MILEFEPVTQGIRSLMQEWEPKLRKMQPVVITQRKNSQNRSIKQILGHMIDSASNNIHRVVHLQYQTSPFLFPNYASHGNNDRWIAIQHYQEEDWELMISLWKYSNLHWVHVVGQVDPSKLDNQWIAGEGRLISLREGITDYFRHFKLHLGEIEALLSAGQ